MTHISSHTADSLYLGIFIRAPPATTQSCLNCIRPPSRAVFTSTVSTFTWPSTMFNTHTNSLAHTEHCSLPITNKGKKWFFFYFHVFIYLFLPWALSLLLWQMIHSLLCELLKRLCGIWIKLWCPSTTPKHKILPLVCAFLHWGSEETLVNICTWFENVCECVWYCACADLPTL